MKKILIVDDDKNFIDTLKDNFKMKEVDADVRVADTAKKAIEILKKEIPSIIILDVQLPDMNGMEVLKIIKASKRLKHVPVILISAKYTEPSDRAEAMFKGAATFFSKPVNVDDIWDEIEYLLNIK